MLLALGLVHGVKAVGPLLDALHGAELGAPAAGGAADFGNVGILQGLSPEKVILGHGAPPVGWFFLIV